MDNHHPRFSTKHGWSAFDRERKDDDGYPGAVFEREANDFDEQSMSARERWMGNDMCEWGMIFSSGILRGWIGLKLFMIS